MAYYTQMIQADTEVLHMVPRYRHPCPRNMKFRRKIAKTDLMDNEFEAEIWRIQGGDIKDSPHVLYQNYIT